MEDHDSERLTDVVNAVRTPGGDDDPGDDDPIGMRIRRGTEVGGYVIDGKLGHGGMGVVYSATHPVIGKRAAIKILRPEVSSSPITVERFIQEARAVNKIGHPNIIDIFAYGALPDGRAYHVMDLLVGEPLRKRLKREVLHPSEAASVIDEIASALTAAHEHGFVHRDLKPDNVFLVSREGRWPEVKLLDFGLAKLMPDRGVAPFTTRAGAMLGTPEYMSPEQARGVGVDYRTDIYALGVVMFEILAGTRPFPPLGDSWATLLQHAEEPPMSLADTVPGLPFEMVQLVDAMLAKTPGARPSLAAVRTVIKRLRTTQLPTRSLAGHSVASFSQLANNPAYGLSPSQVGAQAMLPGDSRHRPDTRPPQLSPAALALIASGRHPVTGNPLPAISNPNSTTPGVGAPRPARPSSPPPVAVPAALQHMQPMPMQPVTGQPITGPQRSVPPPLAMQPMPGPPITGPQRSVPPPVAMQPMPGPPIPGPQGSIAPPIAMQPVMQPMSVVPAATQPPPMAPPGLYGNPPPMPSHGDPLRASGQRPRSHLVGDGPMSHGDPLRVSQRIPRTELGLGPPNRPSGAQPLPDASVRRRWFILAVMLLAAAAIALVIAATGT